MSGTSVGFHSITASHTFAYTRNTGLFQRVTIQPNELGRKNARGKPLWKRWARVFPEKVDLEEGALGGRLCEEKLAKEVLSGLESVNQSGMVSVSRVSPTNSRSRVRELRKLLSDLRHKVVGEQQADGTQEKSTLWPLPRETLVLFCDIQRDLLASARSSFEYKFAHKHAFIPEPLHPRECLTVGLSKNGKRVVAGFNDGLVVLYDVLSSTEVTRLKLRGDVEVTSVIWDRSTVRSTKFAIGTADGAVLIVYTQQESWKQQSVEELVNVGSRINQLHMSANGSIVAVAAARSVYIYDAESAACRWKFDHHDRVTSVSFDSKGARIATGCDDGKARVYESRRAAAG